MDKYRSLKQKLTNCEKVAMANVMLLSSPLMLSAFENADCIRWIKNTVYSALKS